MSATGRGFVSSLVDDSACLSECGGCGSLPSSNWRSCIECQRNRRRAQVRDSQRKRRREKKYEAALVDRVADLRRRLPKGELLPVAIAYLPTGQHFAISRRQLQLIRIPPEVFGSFLPTRGAGRLREGFAFVGVPPWRVFMARTSCLEDHSGLSVEVGLHLPGEIGALAATPQQVSLLDVFVNHPARKVKPEAARPGRPIYTGSACPRCVVGNESRVAVAVPSWVTRYPSAEAGRSHCRVKESFDGE